MRNTYHYFMLNFMRLKYYTGNLLSGGYQSLDFSISPSLNPSFIFHHSINLNYMRSPVNKKVFNTITDSANNLTPSLYPFTIIIIIIIIRIIIIIIMKSLPRTIRIIFLYKFIFKSFEITLGKVKVSSSNRKLYQKLKRKKKVPSKCHDMY